MSNEIPEGETLSREYLANERTLLSWLRTGISAIGLGIFLYFAAYALNTLSVRIPGMESQYKGLTILAIAIVVFGVCLELLATARFIYHQRSISRGNFTSYGLVYLLLILSLAALGVAYAIYTAIG